MYEWYEPSGVMIYSNSLAYILLRYMIRTLYNTITDQDNINCKLKLNSIRIYLFQYCIIADHVIVNRDNSHVLYNNYILNSKCTCSMSGFASPSLTVWQTQDLFTLGYAFKYHMHQAQTVWQTVTYRPLNISFTDSHLLTIIH